MTNKPAITLETAKFANLHLHTDVEAFEIVRVVSNKTIEVRRLDAVLDPAWKPVFHVGGFAANCSNQQSQVWNYSANESAPVIRARLRKDGKYHSVYGTHRLSETPRKFHDYNF